MNEKFWAYTHPKQVNIFLLCGVPTSVPVQISVAQKCCVDGRQDEISLSTPSQVPKASESSANSVAEGEILDLSV